MSYTVKNFANNSTFATLADAQQHLEQNCDGLHVSLIHQRSNGMKKAHFISVIDGVCYDSYTNTVISFDQIGN